MKLRYVFALSFVNVVVVCGLFQGRIMQALAQSSPWRSSFWSTVRSQSTTVDLSHWWLPNAFTTMTAPDGGASEADSGLQPLALSERHVLLPMGSSEEGLTEDPVMATAVMERLFHGGSGNLSEGEQGNTGNELTESQERAGMSLGEPADGKRNDATDVAKDGSADGLPEGEESGTKVDQLPTGGSDEIPVGGEALPGPLKTSENLGSDGGDDNGQGVTAGLPVAQGASLAASATRRGRRRMAGRSRDCANSCGWHGVCQGRKCLCTALFTGRNCSQAVPLAKIGYIKYFREGYDGPLTMSKQNMQDATAVDVYLNRPGESSRKLTVGPVSQELFESLPEEDVFPPGHIYRSCAVVGNSGILSHYENGLKIDDHELVLRLNAARSSSFERQVGTRTTHRITAEQSFGFRESWPEQVLVFVTSTQRYADFLSQKLQHPALKLAAFHPLFMQYVTSCWPWYFSPSTGLWGVMLALQRCASVDLYGFQVSKEYGVHYNYADPCIDPPIGQHFEMEWQILKALSQAGVLKFGDPCIAV
ncbi:hypothetical protein CBR_g20295 [Chara braunii]|uniref:EGF-like domain-containing protein n=1 Tax=Chara braunii TaxID=69332 RepID=A0A388L071_CHABU|nr:hypothetical protein CBR_g20295 [Chara braunii]|eukprot:GBG75668.1 hypothetical protein CBR_g20295 [Chara braunii]